jgi:hypothetical protein
MSIQDAITYMERVEQWRSGDDDRTMEEAGIVPRKITEATAVLLAFAKATLAARQEEPKS